MKESDSIRMELQLDASDNDSRISNYFRKIARAERHELFLDELWPKLIDNFRVGMRQNDEYVIYNGRKTFSIFPRANSIRWHASNKWGLGYGLNYVRKLIKEKENCLQNNISQLNSNQNGNTR